LRIINNKKKIDPLHPDPQVIKDAAAIIDRGGVVIIPTRCLYGLAVDALNAAAVQRVFALKKRALDNPLLVLIKSVDQLPGMAVNIPVHACRIMERFWPGKVTLVFQAQNDLPVELTAGTGKIGIRLPGHDITRAVVRLTANPITGTSANLSGKAGCSRVTDLDPAIAENADLIIDAGPLKGGVGSTIVDVTCNPPIILREGEVSAEDILTVAAS
jgi:L-threonylcarbamoyladenylate synthase